MKYNLIIITFLFTTFHSKASDDVINKILTQLDRNKFIEHESDLTVINLSKKDTFIHKYFYQIRFNKSDSIIFGDFFQKIDNKEFNIYNSDEHFLSNTKKQCVYWTDLKRIKYWKKYNVVNPASILEIYQILKRVNKENLGFTKNDSSITIEIPQTKYWDKIEVDTNSFVRIKISYNDTFFPICYEITTLHEKDTINYRARFKELKLNTIIDDNQFTRKNSLIKYDLVEFVHLNNFVVGDKLPNWRYQSIGEHNYNKLYDIKDTVILIEFWMVSCQYCIQSIPFLKEIKNKYRDSAFKLIYLNGYEGDSDSEIIEFKKKYNIDFKIARFSDIIAGNSFPTFLIIDKTKKLRYISLSYGGDRMKDEIDKLISQLLKN